MKGAVAAMLATARGYTEANTTPEVPVGFAFVGDEEVGGSDSLLDAPGELRKHDVENH